MSERLDAGMTLGEMFGERVPVAAAGARIPALALDSRLLRPGGLFLACAGGRSHGLEFLEDALSRGAAAVAWEPAAGQSAPPADVPVPCFAVPHLRARLGTLADDFYRHPSADLAVVGITGTNGKTTCAWLFAHALQRVGSRCGVIGTLGSGFVDDLREQGLTTPDVIAVHERLAHLRRAGASVVVMEVSSHALDQGRVDGVRFAAAAFTNLTRDHLDYHGDLARYGDAKQKLFFDAGPAAAIVNIDDDYGADLFDRLAGNLPRVAVSARDRRPATDVDFVCAEKVISIETGLRIELQSSWGRSVIESRLLGEFNAENLLLVAALLLQRGVAMSQVSSALAAVPAPPGRMETFAAAGHPTAVVDYAHTPDALEKALVALRLHCRGRLFCVFGAGGDRDRGKRAEMGAVVARLADRVVLTDDNPRLESAADIVADIREGIPATTATSVIHDRAAAIEMALDEAAVGDMVLVAGKGHEATQIAAGTTRSFSDRDVVRAWLERSP